jgi:UDP-N-acetylmuramate dehydrogenase
LEKRITRLYILNAKVIGLMNLFKNFSLKYYNTFGVDVNAKYFLQIDSDKDLDEFLKSELIKKEPILILGSGSNILFTRDYEGVVLKYSKKEIRIIEESESNLLLESAAGELWDDLVCYTVSNKFYGIENLSLIPGTVGAAPIQNIGAYGVELKDVLYSVEYIDLVNNRYVTLNNSECIFSYRNSIFKNQLKDKILITRVILELSKEKKLCLSYKSLHEELHAIPQEKITIELVSDTVKKIRRSKLPDPKEFGNAGSFFKNPEVDRSTIKQLIKQFHDIVYFKQNENAYKISAGWLIEKCGYKGKRIGNVGAFEKQALIITNYGGASGKEILDFTERINADVENKFGIKLISEVNIIL